MRAFSPLTLCLLLAAGPALAGSDFCDSGGGKTEPPDDSAGVSAKASPTDPSGGSCEANMIVTNQAQTAGNAYWRLRDLRYTSANMDALKGFPGWPELPLCLEEVHLPSGTASLRAPSGVIDPPIGEPAGPYSESTFLEWAFQPDALEIGERVLALTVMVDSRGTYLRADWLDPPTRDWSYLNGATPRTLSSRTVRLYGSGQAAPRRFTLLHDGAFVRVGLGLPVSEWISFALPNAQWHPTRLRNGLVKGSPLTRGMGLRVGWPSVSLGTLDSDGPDPSGPGQPEPEPPDPSGPHTD